MYKYDKGAECRLYALQKSFPHAVPLFGGAIWAATAIANGDFESFVWYLPSIVKSADFWDWKYGVEAALTTFCDLCLVDSKLVEAYLGMSLAKFANM